MHMCRHAYLSFEIGNFASDGISFKHAMHSWRSFLAKERRIGFQKARKESIIGAAFRGYGAIERQMRSTHPHYGSDTRVRRSRVGYHTNETAMTFLSRLS